MDTLIYSLKSDFDPAVQNASHQYIGKDITVTVEMPCLGQAARVCTDIKTALEYGAVPAAHVTMLSTVKMANDAQIPMACKLEYTP